MSILIRNPGLLATIQDGGRHGFRRYGLTTSGAADLDALHNANLLVGNDLEEAGLEITLYGFSAEITEDIVIAITGGDLQPKRNGLPCPMYKAIAVKRGDMLSFGAAVSGCRAYIAFGGGLDISPVMGSCSTYEKANLGGLNGRKLQAGDEIPFRKPGFFPTNIEKRVFPNVVYSGFATLRVLMGPNVDRFTESGIRTFLDSTYTVSQNFDRMGYRLEGNIIQHTTDSNIISDGIVPGSIQVPDSGMPMIMLSDCQTTGGYTKIATVISVDLPKLAQCKGGDKIRFVPIEIEEAQNLLLKNRRKLREQQSYLDSLMSDTISLYKLYMDGEFLDVTVEEIS